MRKAKALGKSAPELSPILCDPDFRRALRQAVWLLYEGALRHTVILEAGPLNVCLFWAFLVKIIVARRADL